ncbi:MAG: proteasome accessory factor PafA2 family protein [Myxococcota bacterium]|nr:proteasome accessory factor PafA2 family protein [Myxococcota bacterium]
MRRVAGIEQEYAIRYSPVGGEGRPSHRRVFLAFLRTLSEELQPGIVAEERLDELEAAPTPGMGAFVLNGGRVYYEALSKAPDGGLIELATPECRGANQLLVYERAQDALLRRALPGMRRRLARAGYPGELDLLKNCRDAAGHVYGTQENVEVEVARGPALLAYRALAALLLPWPIALTLALWAILISVALVVCGLLLALGLVYVTIALGLGALGLAGVRARRAWSLLDRALAWPDRHLGVTLRGRDHRGAVLLHRFDHAMSYAFATPHLVLARLFLFGRVRRDLGGLLASRVVLSGAGVRRDDGGFGLSEKADAIGALQRWHLGTARAILDPVESYRATQGLVALRVRQVGRLFARRQRLQLGCSDASLAEVGGLLKIGTLLEALALSDDGALADLPRPRDPVAALRAFSADPSLTARVPMSDGAPRTALEIQRLYLERAEAAGGAVDPERLEILRLWRESLDALERDPRSLFGRIDWVTKRELIARCADDDASATKVALRYAELEGGYFRALERDGLTDRVLDDAEIERAVTEAPSDTRAFARARLVRRLAREGGPREIGWDRVRVGPRFRGKVIFLFGE